MSAADTPTHNTSALDASSALRSNRMASPYLNDAGCFFRHSS
jgi:hypothetical protein